MSLTSEPGSFGLERLPRQDSEISTALEAEQRPSSSSLHSEADPDSPLLIAKRGQRKRRGRKKTSTGSTQQMSASLCSFPPLDEQDYPDTDHDTAEHCSSGSDVDDPESPAALRTSSISLSSLSSSISALNPLRSRSWKSSTAALYSRSQPSTPKRPPPGRSLSLNAQSTTFSRPGSSSQPLSPILRASLEIQECPTALHPSVQPIDALGRTTTPQPAVQQVGGEHFLAGMVKDPELLFEDANAGEGVLSGNF